ncbi:serine/threonine protein kinase [Stigmatella aurantiaca]|uniref:non-specific serine/threonine protein kinase n=1 Tax=Stigmatella aurantiaca (strain DW4/3-1) TaxID=378806 RepID=Q09AV2_STIAD|nr:serine/threonine-protein kinase [Stigmatella aurantiaca]ADO72426.1 Protein kinase [Stigmatella aurantiaca DW4/3-1]EAU68902.1 protein kinase [Stigmatella aurantiaca DW4/3-1]
MHPALLSPGTVVGGWRVVSPCGRGAYGVIYKAGKVGHEEAGPFALKMALHALDPRFEREAELLSRLHHPSVPRLHDRRVWGVPGGDVFPYLVMDWVDGVSLYERAEQQGCTSRQVMQWLSQVARALEAVHEEEGVHRDVKGDNVRVRTGDGRAVLMDFGSGNYRRAAVLTHQTPPPGTPRYYSPESLRFQWEHRRQPVARYEALPADDLYALGVTAYRLVTGRYPPEALGMKETQAGFQPVYPEWEPPGKWVSVHPELEALIRRWLSVEPADRGSAAEAAEGLEHWVKKAGPDADHLIAPRQAPDRTALAKAPWLAVAAGMCLVAGAWWMKDRFPMEGPEEGAQGTHEGGESGGLGDAGVPPLLEGEPFALARQGIGLAVPKKPFPGQRRPPCKPRVETEIHGGCWSPHREMPPCDDSMFEWQGSCYVPVLDIQRPTTSE